MDEEIKPAALLKTGGSDSTVRSEAAKLMGSISSDRKRLAAQQNAKLGGKPKGATDSDEVKAKKAAAAKAAWARRKASVN